MATMRVGKMDWHIQMVEMGLKTEDPVYRSIASMFGDTITIPAGRGARHKARRLALANPGIHVKVMDKRGVCHYTANALHTGTIYATIYYWQRGNPVHHFITRRHPSAQEIASMLRRRDIVRILDDPSLRCKLCDNSVCWPHWPEVDRCKVEQAPAAETC